jgi:hypothetical protein
MFCKPCGTPIFGKSTGMPGHMTALAGTLENSDDVAPNVAIYTRSRRSWDNVASDVVALESQPDWKPEDGV